MPVISENGKEYGFPLKWKRVKIEGKQFVSQIRGGEQKVLMSTWGFSALKNRFLVNPFSRQPAFKIT